jgi:hypothetical protein
MLGDEREELILRQEVSEGQGSNVQVCAVIRKRIKIRYRNANNNKIMEGIL